jgi:ABC-type lipoprotein export system ATPase subunit
VGSAGGQRPTASSATGDGVAAGHLSLRLGGRDVVADVSLSAAPGTLTAVTGPSGSGKSSLLALLAGLVRPTVGTVAFDGRPVLPADLGIQLQSYGLLAALTAAENVELALRARTARGRNGRALAAQLHGGVAIQLARVGLTELADEPVEELSGGQQQRVALARALVAVPSLLIADEPTSEVDAESRERLTALLHEEARRGAVVIVATHDPEVALTADQVVTLVDGRRTG